MSQDPAFLFYPGDYLRDTQCLSESVQVAYDRIMCEHMRNICISQQQLNFFTKRLTVDEKSELLCILHEIDGGFMIKWVADSINKRKAYSDSRRANRSTKNKNIICKTYDEHMENANAIDSVIKNDNKNVYGGEFEKLWELYPKKDGKKSALRNFNATVKNESDLLNIIKALENYRASIVKTEYRFMKNGSTWFNNWQDWVEYNPRQLTEIQKEGRYRR